MKSITHQIKLTILFLALQTINGAAHADIDNTTIKQYDAMISMNVNSLEKLAQIYPKTTEEIRQWTMAAIQLAKQETNDILAIKERSFKNTMQALDTSVQKLNALCSGLNILLFTHPDQAIRDAEQEALSTLQDASIDLYINPSLYHAMQEYTDQFQSLETLTREDELLLDSFLTSCKRSGLHLPEAELNHLKDVSKELAMLEQQFIVNINNDHNFITVTKNNLQGLSDSFINQLQRDDNDAYQVTVDLPTYITVMAECSNSSTRKALYVARNNIAYPDNDTLLIHILNKRDELATILGYSSYATMDLDRTSAANIENVETFLTDIAKIAHQKTQAEFTLLKTDLPDGIECSEDGSLQPWDYLYATTQYNKKHYSIDETFIAEHFPIQKVIDGIFEIYQNFLGLTFKTVKPLWSWHEDVYLIEIYRQSSNELLGYLFLDLHPRPNKYSHACVAEHIGSFAIGDNNKTSVAVMITNFPKPSSDAPSLLKHDDIVTFFHEFGHAMHFVLGRTKHASHAGFNVSCDFTEVPSQMFEQWMFEPEIVANMSSHHQTNTQLALDVITNKVELRKAESGYHILRQCMYALFALRLMTHSDLSYQPTELWKSLHDTYLTTLLAYEPTNHSYAAFGHLAAAELYGAKYYSYLWTEVFAIDLYAQIKQNNYNQQYSQKVQRLLSAGGSVPSYDLLTEFLGREPNQEAFIAALGLQ